MVLYQIKFKEFTGTGIKSPANHPLLREKKFSIKATQKDSQVIDITVKNNTFTLTNLRKFTYLEFNFWSVLNLTGKEFVTIKIVQQFNIIENAASKSNPGIEPSLNPTVWLSRDQGQQNKSQTHLGKHPLLEYDDVKHEISLNCLVIDLTDFWIETHKDNKWYVYHKFALIKYKINFSIFAHLYGPPLIWYVCVSEHLRFKNNLSPHIFFGPADYTESQSPYGNNAQEYGKKDMEYIKAGIAKGFSSDGENLIPYLSPPVDDVDVEDIRPFFNRFFPGHDIEEFRNVVTTKKVTFPKFGFFDKPQPSVWDTFMGLEKAFAGDEIKPNQLLLVPQRPFFANNVFAVTNHLKNIVEGIMNMLWTNCDLINQNSSKLTIDKYVLSCFSQAGVDLWEAGTNNIDNVKAVIAIEPQNLNKITNKEGKKTGKHVIPEFLKRNIKVFIIGRHHSSYKLAIEDKKILDAIHFKPNDPKKVFEYPPNQDSNDFIRYRVTRIKDIDSDPLMTQTERQLLETAKSKLKPPNTLFNLVFHPRHNMDFTRNADGSREKWDGVDHWYSHQFAFSGGEFMSLPSDYEKPDKGMYNRPVKYKTFFQECVEEIG